MFFFIFIVIFLRSSKLTLYLFHASHFKDGKKNEKDESQKQTEAEICKTPPTRIVYDMRTRHISARNFYDLKNLYATSTKAYDERKTEDAKK